MFYKNNMSGKQVDAKAWSSAAVTQIYARQHKGMMNSASKSNRSGSFRSNPHPSLSRQSSLPASTERPIKFNTSTGGIRDQENAMNNSSLLEDPEPEALKIDASNYDDGKENDSTKTHTSVLT